MDEISFDDWSQRLDHFNNSSESNNSVWLPAYGFPSQDSNEDNLFLATAVIADSADDVNMATGAATFLVLETIFEEESDELDTSDTESVTSDTCSDSDVASVIHISPDDSESERDVEVPKKRRRRDLLYRGRALSDDEDNLSRSSSLLQFESLERAISRSSSLLQFETLEQSLNEEEPTFRTSATNRPFVTESQPPSFSSFCFDSLEPEDTLSRTETLKDSLDSSSDSSDGEEYFLERHKPRQSRLRSYRSFDSLVLAVRPSKLSTSLENSLAEEGDLVPELRPVVTALRSSDNLSEDSGFGDMVKRSPPQGGVALSKSRNLQKEDLVEEDVKISPERGVVTSRSRDLQKEGVVMSRSYDLQKGGVVEEDPKYEKILPERGVATSRSRDLQERVVVEEKFEDVNMSPKRDVSLGLIDSTRDVMDTDHMEGGVTTSRGTPTHTEGIFEVNQLVAFDDQLNECQFSNDFSASNIDSSVRAQFPVQFDEKECNSNNISVNFQCNNYEFSDNFSDATKNGPSSTPRGGEQYPELASTAAELNIDSEERGRRLSWESASGRASELESHSGREYIGETSNSEILRENDHILDSFPGEPSKIGVSQQENDRGLDSLLGEPSKSEVLQQVSKSEVLQQENDQKSVSFPGEPYKSGVSQQENDRGLESLLGEPSKIEVSQQENYRGLENFNCEVSSETDRESVSFHKKLFKSVTLVPLHSDRKTVSLLGEPINSETSHQEIDRVLVEPKVPLTQVSSANKIVPLIYTDPKSVSLHGEPKIVGLQNKVLSNPKFEEPKIVGLQRKINTDPKLLSCDREPSEILTTIINAKNDGLSFTEIIHNSKEIYTRNTSIIHAQSVKNELSINICEPLTNIHTSAPSLLLANMASREFNQDWNMDTEPLEITEEVLHKKVQVGGVAVTENKNKTTKFGNFFQRFSFRRNKKKNTSQENLDLEDEAINSVQAVANELSNLDQISTKKSPKSDQSPKKSPKLDQSPKSRPPLPPVGPPKSRLLGIVGRKREEANTQAPAPQIDNVHNGSKKASSLVNLGTMNVVEIDLDHDYEADQKTTLNPTQEPRAKSMEFLLDAENKAAVLPPENELRKVSERQLSEHELRVQRSLQRLNVPDWYKNTTPSSGHFILKRSGSAHKAGGWPGLNSKTTSLSSLQPSPSPRSKYSNSHHNATPSPVISPSPQERLSFSYAPFSRWSTSRLNSGPTSANTSPSGSTRSSFHYRQPYLGWRSQEKLLSSTPSHYRTPAERLAANMVTKPPLPPAVSVQPPPSQAHLNEVHSSIKEVTSAIVHYVKEKNLSPSRPGDLDRSPSPRGSKTRVWVESSFVGSRPLDSPQTPQIPADDNASNGYPSNDKLHAGHGFMDIRHNGATTMPANASDSPRHLSLEVRHQHIDLTIERHNIDLTIDRHKIDLNIDDVTCSLDNVSDTSETNDELDVIKPALQQELTQLLENFGNSRPSSATLEDVLDSLLGLPTASRSPSPVISPRGSNSQLNSKEGGHEGSASVDTSLAPYYVSETTARRHSSGALHKTAKTRRVSFELEPMSLTSTDMSLASHDRRVNFELGPTCHEVSLDSAPCEDLVRCRYAKCGRSATVIEARRSYKTCHNCNSHVYCSRECRRAHWEKGHRKTCLHGRIGALCRRVVNACKEHSPSLDALSKLARRGYLAHGRGCVKVFFSSPELAERFTNAVISATVNESLLPGDPCFIRWSDFLPSEMGSEQYKEILRLCKSYNPDTRLILYVAVCVISEVPSSGSVKWERQLITRCSKLRLHRNHVVTAPIDAATAAANVNITRDMDNPETVILTPVTFSSENKIRQREIAFTNIQRHLRQRGISLRKHFPEIYRKLCGYVENNEHFTPVTIYPKDSVSGRNFMCIIMPDCDPDKLQNVPTDSSRVHTVDIGQEVF